MLNHLEEEELLFHIGRVKTFQLTYKTARKVGQFRSKVKKDLLKLSNKIIEKLEFEQIPDEDHIIIESKSFTRFNSNSFMFWNKN